MYYFFFQVIDLPDQRPQITGGNDRGYRVGDWLDVNCTSPKSNPPSLLKWYINDELPTESYVIPIAPQKLSGDLFTARQRLRLQLKRQHFVHGEVTLKCTARIYKEYYMSMSKSYQGLGLSEKALEISGRANGKLTNKAYSRLKSSKKCNLGKLHCITQRLNSMAFWAACSKT